MRALTLVADRKVELLDVADSPLPGAGEVQVRIKAIGLNHLDVWGWRGMAFAKRKLPLVVGVEAAGEIVAVGDGGTAFKPGDRVATFAWNTLYHLEMYFAVMGVGLVCHTLNPRMSLTHLAGMINEAQQAAQ